MAGKLLIASFSTVEIIWSMQIRFAPILLPCNTTVQIKPVSTSIVVHFKLGHCNYLLRSRMGHDGVAVCSVPFNLRVAGLNLPQATAYREL